MFLLLAFFINLPAQAGEAKKKDEPKPAPPPIEAAQPRITFVCPAGGQRGKTVEAALGGTNLATASSVRITGQGVAARIVSAADTTCRVSFQIAPDAELGERDLRLISPGGASNRYRFFVGDLPEINEVEPNSDRAQAQLLPALPVVVNGQITETDRDFFRFAAKSSECLLLEIQARQIVPYIADAVPGWFDACLTLYDSDGRQLAQADDFRFRPDPMLSFTAPKDGEYTVEVRDVIYRGRNDMVYRLTIGKLPFVTHVFPLGGPRGSTVQVELRGVNLQTDKASLTVEADGPVVRSIRPLRTGLAHNTLLFAAGDTPEVTETEPNDTPDKANPVEFPVTINGRIQRSGDVDCYSFQIKTAQKLVLEVQARRLASPLDSFLTVFTPKGAVLASNDDTTDPAESLIPHHADSRILQDFATPGQYVVSIRDTQGKGGDEYAYRLRIAPPEPGFTLRVSPDNPRFGRGDTALIVVNALRKDGFQEPIDISVTGLPEGFVISKAAIPSGQDEARLTVTAPPDAAVATLTPVVTGTAMLGGKSVTRQAAPAEPAIQSFFTAHLVPAREYSLSLVDAPAFTLSTNLKPGEVLEAKQGSEAQVVVKVRRRSDVKNVIGVTLAQTGPRPQTIPGITVKYTPIPADKEEVPFAITIGPQARPGPYDIILTGVLRSGKETVNHFVPAIPLKVLETPKEPPPAAPPQKKDAK